MRLDKYTPDELYKALCYTEKSFGSIKDCSKCSKKCYDLYDVKGIATDVLKGYYAECKSYTECSNHYLQVTHVSSLGLSTKMKNCLEYEGLYTDASVYKRVKTDKCYDWEVLKKMRGCGPKTFSGIVEFFKEYFKENHFETYSSMMENKDLKMLGFLFKYTSFKSLKDIVQCFYNPIEDCVDVDKLDRLIYDLGKDLLFSGRTYGIYKGSNEGFIDRVEYLVMQYRFLYSKGVNENEEDR